LQASLFTFLNQIPFTCFHSNPSPSKVGNLHFDWLL